MKTFLHRSLLPVTAAAMLAVVLLPDPAQAARPAADNPRLETAPALDIPAIHQKLTAAGYSNIRKISYKRGYYKVKAYREDGTRIKLYLDATTGENLPLRGQR